jgi:lysophospholipase L1-like esterase
MTAVHLSRASVVGVLVALGVMARAISGTAQEPPITLRPGDRIAFVGGAFMEREYHYGLIETALTIAHPEKRLTFRNLGWSGDTVRGEARAYFGEPAEGYKALVAAVAEARPDVVLLAYGGNEAFEGEDALRAFVAQYETLLADLAVPGRRLVLLTPPPADAATSPMPPARVEARNRALAEYAGAIRSLAKLRGLATVDLFAAIRGARPAGGPPLFQNGHDLTEAGYLVAARHIAEQTAPARALDGFDVNALGATEDRPGLSPAWATLRALIVEKNDLFFHRWRPANVTYLYLFRQREQGKNAVEIPKFDPLIDEKERVIAGLAAALRSGTGERR